MKFISGIIGWMLLTSALNADVPLLPVYPLSNSFAPYLDSDGYIRPYVRLKDINFGQGLAFPWLLDFSSEVRPPSPEFGQGWDCPLFDAKIFDTQQNTKKVQTLGGRYLYLIYDQRTDTWKHAYSDSWTGKAKGEDFELTYENAWKFVYHNGLISSMTSPGGRTILWNRTGDKLMSLSEYGKSPVLQVAYDTLGFAKQIVLDPDHLGKGAQTFDLSTDLIYAGLSKIQCSDGRLLNFTRSHDKALNPVFHLTDTKGEGYSLTWDNKTGKILSDGMNAYEIAEVNADKTFPQFSRTNYATHKTETFYFDEKHGVTEQKLADGTLRHIEMDISPGPNYKEIRLIQETKNGVTRIVQRRSFDDQHHLLMEVIGLANGKQVTKQYTYDSAGRAVSYIFNGKVMWQNVYDPVTGFLQERDIPDLGVKLAFAEQTGGTVKETIEKAGGEVTSTQTIGNKDWQAKEAFFQEIH